MLTVVVPAYNEENNVKLFYEKISDLFASHIKIIGGYEVIFVDDGSADGTWEQIKILNTLDPKIHGIRFSRNFGKEAAIFAGLHKAMYKDFMVPLSEIRSPQSFPVKG